MTWTLRKSLTATFVALQVLLIGVSAILAVLGWKELQYIQHVREVVWPATRAAWEIRNLNQKEELAVFWSYWGGSSIQGHREMLAEHERLLQVLQKGRIVGAENLARLHEVERQHHEHIEAVESIAAGGQRAGGGLNLEAMDRHRVAMRKLESLNRERDALISKIEADAEEQMSRVNQKAVLYAHAGMAILAGLLVVMVGFSEFLRRLLRRSITEPVEQMAADVESSDSQEPGYRIGMPKVHELSLVAGAINRFLERLEAAEAERRQMDRSLIRAERMASVGVVASGIVHNLKNPLAVISGMGQMLQLARPDLEEAGRIVDAARQMNRMIEEILARGRQVGAAEPVDVNRILARELDFLQADLVFKHQVKREVQFAEGLPAIEGVPTDFSQVFGNLLHNAVDAMRGREVKRLRVTTSAGDKSIVVEVSDTGCGIPEEDIPRLFEPFFTTKASGAEGGGPVGTGLGLYTVRRLLEPYGAAVEVESTVNVGTTFRIRIPIATSTTSTGGNRIGEARLQRR